MKFVDYLISVLFPTDDEDVVDEESCRLVWSYVVVGLSKPVKLIQAESLSLFSSLNYRTFFGTNFWSFGFNFCF